jgi:NADPH-dependent curcumin reductase CurA
MINTRVLLAKRPEGLPSSDCFTVDEVSTNPRAAGSIRCKTDFLSLDPYMRGVIGGNHMGQSVEVGGVIPGEGIATIIESDDSDWPVGVQVRCRTGWQSISDHQAQDLNTIPQGLSQASLALSILGMPGLTAYAGMHSLAKVRTGDTVLIPAAIGGVGAMAGQLCRLAGAKTIGISSGPEKCKIATEKLGYTHCIDRLQGDIAEQLQTVAPEGLDVYFDLVGDPILTIAAQQLALNGRVVLCGLIQDYSGQIKTMGPPPGLWIGKRATVMGLVVYDFEHEREAFEKGYAPLIEQGLIQGNESIYDGLAQAPQAFCDMMSGVALGKVVIAV